MKPKVISIIGGRGQMGAMFAKAFRSAGYKVLISGRDTPISHVEAAERGDVVIVTVPIRYTEETLKKIGPHVRKGALLTDFTSVKMMPAKAMTKYSSAEVIAGHPVFGPTSGFAGHTYVLCPIRGESYLKWYKKFLTSLGLIVIIMTPKEHDRAMSKIQVLRYTCDLAFATTLAKLGCSPDKDEALASPLYLMKTYEAGRLLSQDAKLYSDISIENNFSKEIIDTFTDTSKILQKIINNKDKEAYEKLFTEASECFGEYSSNSVSITDELIKKLRKLQKKSLK
jgi:prephenate dehydrogenase